MILNLTGNLEDGLGESLDVGGGDTSDGDTAVLGGVDGVLEKWLEKPDWRKDANIKLTSLARESICSGLRPV